MLSYFLEFPVLVYSRALASRDPNSAVKYFLLYFLRKLMLIGGRSYSWITFFLATLVIVPEKHAQSWLDPVGQIPFALVRIDFVSFSIPFSL